MTKRLVVLVAVGVLTLAACATALNSDDQTVETAPSTAPDAPTVVPQDEPSAVDSVEEGRGSLPDGPSALESMNDDAFPDALVDTAQIISGGPPPDGIPPIDDPRFVEIADNMDFLPSDEPVVSLVIDGDARAYPIRAMVWHEIVNDTVGGVPVVVSYCPLCNSAATYERTVDGTETTFGTSGLLFASALVMYDRATESLWTHYNGTAVVGVLAGQALVEHPSPLLAWSDFVEAFPDGKVLDWRQTGFDRDYGANPYVGYDDVENTPFLFRGALDDRAAAMRRVIGITLVSDSVAFALDHISDGDGSATNTTVGETPVVILWKAGQSSALDGSTVFGGSDVGSAATFLATVDGEVLTFDFKEGRFMDRESGSTWTITGVAVDGDMEGARLTAVPHLDTFWFAWSTYRPGTRLVEG